ncbi:hypothetical protein C8F01DRAFT_1092449 [Mycena amicta]|nr:hypothetical protein C8F01DRAFT_1092449 [Mycena amicta]
MPKEPQPRKTHGQAPKTAMQAKKLKRNEYKIPDKLFYAYISAPWPYPTWTEQPSTATQRAQQQQIVVNHTLLWVSCMVQDLCKVTMDETRLLLYRKGTTADVIIQLEAPEGVDAATFQAILGAHRDFTFVPSEYSYNTILYEYNYKRFNDPALVGWEECFAQGASFEPQHIVPTFPVKRNGQYPPPLPVKPQHRSKQFVVPLPAEPGARGR